MHVLVVLQRDFVHMNTVCERAEMFCSATFYSGVLFGGLALAQLSFAALRESRLVSAAA